ncbi:hypothetical protein RAB80_014184 [Fusarium oxysporum f. sp. vasinfectum]|nr:hypothetical protein RAB80_014184 [Fusarium oxysporum f. sp. vasinfectum]
MPLGRRTAHLVFTASILPGHHLKPKLSDLLLAFFHSLIIIFHRPNHAGAIEGRFVIVLLEERLAVLDGGIVEVGALGGEGHDDVSEGGLRQGLSVHGDAGSEFIDPGAVAQSFIFTLHEGGADRIWGRRAIVCGNWAGRAESCAEKLRGAAARAAWVVEHEAASAFRIDSLGTIMSWNREKWRGNAFPKRILTERFRLRPNWRA